MSTLYVNNLTPNSGGTVSISGSLYVSGNITLGDTNTDGISFGADVSSSIVPDANNTYELGSSSSKWSNVHATNFLGLATSASYTLSSSTAVNAVTASHLNPNGAAPSQNSITSLGVLTGLNVLNTASFQQINILGSVSASGGIIGTLHTSPQPAITSVGVLTSLTCSGDISASGTVFADNFQSAGGDDTISFTDNMFLNGAMTIQGTISSSGAITSSGFLGALNGNANTATTASYASVAATASVAIEATVATTVTITDNESTNENNALIFTAGGDLDGGNLGLESDGTLFYNPSTGKVTATGFVGALTGQADSSITSSYANNASAVGANDVNIIALNDIALSAPDDISLTSTSADGLITLHSAHTAGQSILIDANANAGSILDVDAGIIDVDVQGLVTIDSVGLSIDSAGVAANITSTTDGAAEDFTIALAGATDSSLILSSTGTGADALQITTTAGGIDISATGNAAGEDIDISSAASVNVTATENAANAIYLRANGGTSETIKIHSDQGTGAGSVEITSDAGSIDINSGDNITVDAADDITVTADNVSMVANVTAAKIQSPTTAVTATDAGAAIPAGTAVALVNADSDANHIVILPAPVVGNIIHIIENGTTGYELRTSTPASIGINGGTASNGESAIAGAITYVRCVCVSSTSWIATQFDADGDESKVEAAA